MFTVSALISWLIHPLDAGVGCCSVSFSNIKASIQSHCWPCRAVSNQTGLLRPQTTSLCFLTKFILAISACAVENLRSRRLNARLFLAFVIFKLSTISKVFFFFSLALVGTCVNYQKINLPGSSHFVSTISKNESHWKINLKSQRCFKGQLFVFGFKRAAREFYWLNINNECQETN